MHEIADSMENHTVVLGYGDVGRNIINRLRASGVLFVAVDSNETVFNEVDFPYVVGEAASKSTLKKVGLEHASTIIVTLGSDSDIIFTILVARKLNPGAVILARANEVQSIDKMYKAGADYVASLAIISGQMLGRIALLPADHQIREETIMMYEGIEIKKYTVNASSPLVGKTLVELDLRNTIGCTIIGIQIGDRTISDIDPLIRIDKDMTLAVLGNKEQIEAFTKQFIK